MCGNCGLLLLDMAATGRISPLATMLRVTMARGAQSAGLVTYDKHGVGTRKRVVNGKRTDLCDLLMSKFAAQLQKRLSQPTIFQGHTRFATTSIAQLPGCHPHQWTPPRTEKVWRYDPTTTVGFFASRRNVEAFITHNGDLDFFELHGALPPSPPTTLCGRGSCNEEQPEKTKGCRSSHGESPYSYYPSSREPRRGMNTQPLLAHAQEAKTRAGSFG